jgi:hypothetical protein
MLKSFQMRLPFIKKKKKPSLPFVAFGQAFGVLVYCLLAGTLLWKGEDWFGLIGKTSLGPIFVLTLFSVSVLICALLVFGYPVYLFWDKKQACESLQIVGYTAAWLALFTLLFIFLLLAC